MTSIKIPDAAGVILLNNAVTFPHGALPLHIFEPRYQRMLEDAFAADSMICVANLHSEESSKPGECVAKVGFIGLIRASKKGEDGRSNLILHCLSRVEFLSWGSNPDTVSDTVSDSAAEVAYPWAKIKPIRDVVEPITESTELIIRSLRDAASRFLSQFREDVVAQTNETLDRVNEDLGILSDVIAQQFIIDEDFRQSLLEEYSPTKRAEALIRHLRIQ